jgi:NAD(P)-dependent dehydrogenase (short-subunit alcohol dehydrogenase family)
MNISESNLTPPTALVTGGAGGLGRCLCRMLARAGYHVAVADVRAQAANTVASELQSEGFAATSLMLDLVNAAQMIEAVERFQQEHGHLQVLINNAGIDLTVSIDELPLLEWDKILAVNLRAPFVLTKEVLPGMMSRRQGSVVNIVSTAARRAWPNASAYHASKWGLLGFSHALHTEARPHNIRVTAVIAGGMHTPFLTDRFPDIDCSLLQHPQNVADTVEMVLKTPAGSVIPEIVVLPLGETSWP